MHPHPHDERLATARDLDRRRVRAASQARLFGAEPAEVCIDRFVVEAKIGEGASSVVYAAFDRTLSRRVALKLVLRDGATPEAALHEARALARFAHPGLLAVYEIGVFEGIPYLVTELVPGGTLRAFMREPREPAEAVAMVLALGDGLAAAHAQGILHRDFKPENVLVGEGRPRIADFGLSSADASSGSGTDAPAGTPMYMSPEHARGERADAASDQFALGLVAYEICFGVHPRLVPSSSPPRGHALAYLEPVLRRAFADEPSARFPSVRAFTDAIASATTRRAKRRALLLGAAMVSVLLAAVGAIALAPPDAEDERAVLAHVLPLMSSERFDACADYLASRAGSERMDGLWIECADHAGDEARLRRACEAVRARRPVPEACDEVRRAAEIELRAGAHRACAERILAAPPARSRTITLARCVSAVRDVELFRAQCIYTKRLEGAPDPEGACGTLREL